MNEAIRLQNFLQTLADANRLRILKFIGSEKRSVGEIVAATRLSQPLVSHHLRVLKRFRILETERSGPFIFYRLTDPKLLEILGLLSIQAPESGPGEAGDRMFRCPPWWRKMNE